DPKTAFACEKDKSKRSFYEGVVAPHMSCRGCMFEDLAELGNGRAKCSYHSKVCYVPMNAHVFVVGFSCKDFSRLTSSLKRDQKGSLLIGIVGSSGTTFHWAFNHIMRARPAIVILENVPDIDEIEKDEDGVGKNVGHLYGILDEIGYSTKHSVFPSTDFGLPQKRRRCFFVCLRREAFHLTADQTAERLESIWHQIDKLKTPPCPMMNFLYGNDHPRVQAELERRQATTKSRDDVGESHRRQLQMKGVSWKDLSVPSDLASNEWFQTLSARQKDCLIYYKSTAPDMITLDINPRFDRCVKPVGTTTQTLTPSMVMWVFQGKKGDQGKGSRLMLGFEAMRLQGFPTEWIESGDWKENDSKLVDLAGNAFSATVFAAIEIAVLATVKFPAQVEVPASELSELAGLLV
ncbi:unnamed protein product, partial [Prorocentrum cordatum]